jgi:hypothetical protein
VFYRRIWNIVGKYSILCCDTSRRDRLLVEAPLGNEMMYQGFILHSRIGHFSHIIVNGFWTCVVVFHSLRWPRLAVGNDTLSRHLRGMKCCSTTLFCHSRIGYFCHLIVNKFWTCVVVFHSLRWPQLAVGTDTLLRNLQGMKCCTRALLYHRRTGHFPSYNLRWILDLCCCIPFPEVASTSHPERHLVKAPPGNEMLQQGLALQ